MKCRFQAGIIPYFWIEGLDRYVARVACVTQILKLWDCQGYVPFIDQPAVRFGELGAAQVAAHNPGDMNQADPIRKCFGVEGSKILKCVVAYLKCSPSINFL